MSVYNTITDMQTEAAKQSALDYAQKVADSTKEGGRNVGGDMGKTDFLLLLAAQLRYQDPLEPQADSDFSAQLAQFSSLEQMQNMNATLIEMNSYQSYSLVGKFVLADTVIDGKLETISGVVDSIFMKSGITYAQIGEYVIPITAITEVVDTNNILTPEMFMSTSNMLIGRTIVADMGKGVEIEGLVTRITVDKGQMYAQVDDGTDEPKLVPVNSIIDIREPGTDRYTPPPATPPEAQNFKNDPDSDGFLELDPDDANKIIGRWDWDREQWKWVYTDLTEAEIEEEPAEGEGEETLDMVA